MKVADKWTGSTDQSDYRTFDRCMVEYSNYVDKYGLPWDEEAKTLGWPDQPMVELAIEVPIPGARHPYCGKLDRPIIVNGQALIEDHKTASQFRADYFRQWELDNQMIGYAVIGEIITELPIAGIRINAHIIHKSDSIFERRTIPFSQQRLKDWTRNYDHWLERLEESALRSTSTDQDLLNAAYPMNLSACASKYGMCQYADVCSMPPKLRLPTLEQLDENPWNPLEVAEETTDA
jgi:hypothetical protein